MLISRYCHFPCRRRFLMRRAIPIFRADCFDLQSISHNVLRTANEFLVLSHLSIRILEIAFRGDVACGEE